MDTGQLSRGGAYSPNRGSIASATVATSAGAWANFKDSTTRPELAMPGCLPWVSPSDRGDQLDWGALAARP